jgi:hypothetical protein
MWGKYRKPNKVALRDDNLRLLFSETELRILDEKRADALDGFYAIATVILVTALIGLFFFATPFPAIWDGTDLEIIIVGLGLLGFLGVLLTIVSPIIIIGLMIELRKAAKEKASLIDLLVRYKRPIPEAK